MSLSTNSMTATQIEEFLSTPNVEEILELQRERELRGFDSYIQMLDQKVQAHMEMLESI